MFMVFAAVIGVGLAGAACYGLCLAIGFPFGATHTGLIFLMLGKTFETLLEVLLIKLQSALYCKFKHPIILT